jgi:hypothetical protein
MSDPLDELRRLVPPVDDQPEVLEHVRTDLMAIIDRDAPMGPPQADELQPRRTKLRTSSDPTSRSGPSTLRRRPLLAAAAAVLGVAGLVGLRLIVDSPRQAISQAPATVAPAPPPPPPQAARYRFDVQDVVFAADDIWVDIDGEQVRPATDAEAFGGIMEWGRGAFLYVSWLEGTEEVRVSFQFGSDGSTWWLEPSESRVNGSEAVTAVDGQPAQRAMELPVDSPFTGDFDVGAIHLRGAYILAIPTRPECVDPSSPIAIVPRRNPIENNVTTEEETPGGTQVHFGFDATVLTIDTATCSQTASDGLEFSAMSTDPQVVTVDNIGYSDPRDMESGEVNTAQIGLVGIDGKHSSIGTAQVRVSATSETTGDVVATTEIDVEVRDDWWSSEG